jgi:hypothetical protein
VPLRLEYPNDGDQEGAEEAPTPSTGTSSTRSKDKSKGPTREAPDYREEGACDTQDRVERIAFGAT